MLMVAPIGSTNLETLGSTPFFLSRLQELGGKQLIRHFFKLQLKLLQTVPIQCYWQGSRRGCRSERGQEGAAHVADEPEGKAPRRDG